MCELYVRTVSKTHPDPYLNVQNYKRGDVVHIAVDGWAWGSAELNNGASTIIKVPGVPASVLQSLLMSEPGDPKINRMLQRRAFGLNLAAYAGGNLTSASALALRFTKPALADPNVIG